MNRLPANGQGVITCPFDRFAIKSLANDRYVGLEDMTDTTFDENQDYDDIGEYYNFIDQEIRNDEFLNQFSLPYELRA